MALKQKSGGAKSIPAGLAIGWVMQILLTMALCLMLAALILSGRVGQEALGYSVPVILIVTAYAGAAASCKLVGHHNLILCLSSAALYLGTLLAIALLLFDGEIRAFWISALLVLGGAMAAMLLCSVPKRSRGERRKKRRM